MPCPTCSSLHSQRLGTGLQCEGDDNDEITQKWLRRKYFLDRIPETKTTLSPLSASPQFTKLRGWYRTHHLSPFPPSAHSIRSPRDSLSLICIWSTGDGEVSGRAHWYESLAISPMNFWAAKEMRRVLEPNLHKVHVWCSMKIANSKFEIWYLRLQSTFEQLRVILFRND